jgi:hypothetical protein
MTPKKGEIWRVGVSSCATDQVEIMGCTIGDSYWVRPVGSRIPHLEHFVNLLSRVEVAS